MVEERRIVRPDPDPSVLTTEQLDKAIANSEAKQNTRFTAIDKAAQLLHEDAVRVPTAIDRAVGDLKGVFDITVRRIEDVAEQKFLRIDAAFVERDKRSEQLALAQRDAADKLAKASSDNIATAMTAQKETADKSEKNILEGMKSLRDIFQTSIGSLTVQINDLKSRIDKGEGRDTGHDQSWGWIVAAVGVVVGLVGAIGGAITVVVTLLRHS